MGDKLERSDRDWTEDFQHENGNYVCKCTPCGRMFFGHKRRVVCKLCDAKPLPSSDKPSDKELVKRLLDMAAWCQEFTGGDVAELLRLAASRLSVPREGYCRYPTNCMSTTCTCGMPLPKAPA